MSGRCKSCGTFNDNGDSRVCSTCEVEQKVRACAHDLELSPSRRLAVCRKCAFVGVWRDGMWERQIDAATRSKLTRWLRENEGMSRSLGMHEQADLFSKASELIGCA